jgi:hypothetical protein
VHPSGQPLYVYYGLVILSEGLASSAARGNNKIISAKIISCTIYFAKYIKSYGSSTSLEYQTGS